VAERGLRVGRFVANAAVVALIALSLAPGTAASSRSVPVDAPATVTAESPSDCARGALPKLETDLTGETADEAERLQAMYEDEAGFLAVVFGESTFWVIVDDANLGPWADEVAGDGVVVVSSCVMSDVADSARAAIAEVTHSAGQFSSVAYNAHTDSVELITTEDPVAMRNEVASRLGQARGASEDAAFADADLQIVEAEASAATRLGRLNDTAPFWGGGKLIYPDGNCSTGFYINSATNGTVMVTAGHCGASGTTVWNGDNTLVVGVVEGRRFPDPDLAVLDGIAYAPRSFSANNNTSSKAISGATSPSLGTTYCQMGYVTRRVCSSYSSLNAQYCDVNGCTNGLAFTSRSCDIGKLGQKGDSGGGVYRELADATLGARGVVVAGPTIGTNTCTRYDHRWVTISNLYQATIVIG
jgi:hypothetical protein